MSAGYMKKCANRNGTPKIAHRTQTEAEGQRTSMIQAGIWTKGSSNTYFCNQCGGYHAGKLGRSNRGGGRRPAKNAPRHLDSQ
jgi:hypothetical protein